MKRYSGNFLSILGNQRSENQVVTETPYTIQLIDAHDIVPNRKNFYGIREIEELATRIRVSGHITPLEVMAKEDEPGKYTLLSGERRRAAMLYRLSQGEIDKAVMPCVVRVDLDGTEALTAEDLEAINIISANDYREKTPFEKLEEVLILRPIARKLWEKAKVEDEKCKYSNDFRAFFAKKVLGVSPSTLQRITIMEKLVPEARDAYNDGLLGKSILYELAKKSEEEQTEYLAGLKTGKNSGTVAEVQTNNQVAMETCIDDTPQIGLEEEPEESKQEDFQELPEADNTPDKPTEATRGIDMVEADRKARQWVKDGLQRLVEEAAGKMEAARERKDKTDAALWDLRRAAATLAIEAMS